MLNFGAFYNYNYQPIFHGLKFEIQTYEKYCCFFLMFFFSLNFVFFHWEF